MRFGNKDAIIREQRQKRFDNRVNIFDMRENIRRGDNLRAAGLCDDLIDSGAVHEGDQRGDAAFDGELAGVGRLDAVNRAARCKIREQRAVVGADVDDQVLFESG